MIRVSANFNQIQNVEIEVTIRATYADWKGLLDAVDQEKYPGYQFHAYVKEAVQKLERQVTVYEKDKE